MSQLDDIQQLIKNQPREAQINLNIPEKFQNPTQPPLNKWQPELSGDIDIVIKSNGDWYHEGGKIERDSLVSLFASILRREQDGHYYLVTPVEKWRIQVEERALVVVDMDVINQSSAQQQVFFTTNVGRKYLLSKNVPLSLNHTQSDGGSAPVISLPQNLTAKLNRAVFYRFMNYAQEQNGMLTMLSDGIVHEWVIDND